MRHANYIGGEWVESADAVTNVSPSDLNDVVGDYALAGDAETRMAIDAAYDVAPEWAEVTPQRRFELLDRIGDAILADKERLGELLAREQGKVLAHAIPEAERAGHTFKFFASEVMRNSGELIPSARPGVNIEVTREPMGVVGLITPWNFPIGIPVWKAAAALAYGNTVVLKPPEIVPGSCWELARIIDAVGVPSGVFNLVIGKGRVVGESLLDSPKVAAISFTGSVSVGQRIAAKVVATGKKVQLEMGGKNPLVVLDDAPLSTAVEAAVDGAFYLTGQRCTASSRIIVTEGMHDRFVAAMRARMGELEVGHALNPQSRIGPVVSAAQLEQSLDYVELARAEGVRVFGGDRLTMDTQGYYMAPALFTETHNGMRINREEMFGPMGAVLRVRDYEEAVATANDTDFGLASGIVTASQKHARHFKRHSQAGLVMVNLPTGGVEYQAPFGGRKGSSYGPREQGRYAAEFYTTVKTAYDYPV